MLRKIRFYRTYIVLGVAFILVLITGIGVFQANQNKEQITDTVIHTFRVLDVSDELVSALIDAETGQRGYLLTNSEQYLEPFNNAEENINQLYNNLVELLSDNKERRESVENDLKPKIDERLRLLQEIVDLYRQGEDEAAMDIVMTNVGKQIMDEIRLYIDGIKSEEEQYLQDQINEIEALLGQGNIVLVIGFGFILLAISISGFSIKKKADENNRLIKRLDDANISLVQTREREALKNRFMGIVAHDLRNPLSMIKSINGMMLDEKGDLTDEHAEYAGYIDQAADQMAVLIRELLDVHKIEEGKIQIYIEELRIYKIIQGLILGHSNHADEKNIEITFRDQSNGQIYKTDKSIFLQVADNLLSNAIKYSPINTEITVSIETSESGLILTIADEGPGIKEEEMEYLFERYGKLSNQPTGGESSTGLGLWIVKERLSALGGSINCKSKPGEGATFTAVFPISS